MCTFVVWFLFVNIVPQVESHFKTRKQKPLAELPRTHHGLAGLEAVLDCL